MFNRIYCKVSVNFSNFPNDISHVSVSFRIRIFVCNCCLLMLAFSLPHISWIFITNRYSVAFVQFSRLNPTLQSPPTLSFQLTNNDSMNCTLCHFRLEFVNELLLNLPLSINIVFLKKREHPRRSLSLLE